MVIIANLLSVYNISKKHFFCLTAVYLPVSRTVVFNNILLVVFELLRLPLCCDILCEIKYLLYSL